MNIRRMRTAIIKSNRYENEVDSTKGVELVQQETETRIQMGTLLHFRVIHFWNVTFSCSVVS